MAFYIFYLWHVAFQGSLDLKTRGALTAVTWKAGTCLLCSVVWRAWAWSPRFVEDTCCRW